VGASDPALFFVCVRFGHMPTKHVISVVCEIESTQCLADVVMKHSGQT